MVHLARLLEQVERRGRVPFLLHGERVVPGGDFARQVRRMAAGLLAAGFQPGDRLALYLEKGPECVVALWAAAVAGGIGVPLHPRARDHQVRHILTDCAPFGLVTSTTKAALLRDPARVFVGCRSWWLDPEAAGLPDLPDRAPMAGLLAGADDGAALRTPAPDQPAVLFYTSGSTGMPKAVVQTHRNLLDGARIVSGYLGLSGRDVVMAVLPLGFDYGLNQVLSAAWCGAPAVLHDHLTAADLVREIEQRRATVLAGVPALWHELALLLEKDEGGRQAARLGSLRLITNSGGRLERRDQEAIRRALPGLAVARMYGLTEAFRSAWLPPGELDHYPDSFGRAIPEVELLLVDPGTGELVEGPGEGELVHAGALVAAGYWNRPEETARRFRPDPRPGFRGMVVYSGDLVARDPAGTLRFVARLDGMLKVDGHRLAPDEVHAPLQDVPGVRALQVVGVPGGAAGHRLVLFAVPDGVDDPAAGPHPDADAREALRRRLERAARSRLPAWMVPAEIRFLRQLPTTDRGKRDLAALRDLAAGPERDGDVS